MGYGIGRVPADVDLHDEARAGSEAQEIMARHTRPAPVGYAPTGTTCGEHVPAGTRCEHRGCQREAAGYNPGAGQSLCRRHWDEY